MIELALRILDKEGNIKSEVRDFNEVRLVFLEEYNEGDKIQIETSNKDIYLVAEIDDAMGESLIYVTQNLITYEIPFGEKKVSYSPKVFYGEKHLLSVRVARKEETECYRNLALNKMDQQGLDGVYPHASANVETRGEAVFAARNAINGNCENHDHGKWPYESWGIGMRDDACLKIDFGREVVTDKIVLYTRSDFPHDNWWVKVTFRFSDNSELTWDLEKSDKAHIITFPFKKISWLTFSDLIKADDPSPFPALSQIEVYGK
ncbi:carbohydrate-binding protein [Clostridium sp. AL.422]|uniref:carbohydrate-binding protein n=1 Tax=Clostridium TaxID=1485 RepID=UPI00293DB92A|nr:MULTISPECIES: carbohydrate-binding protein [unclassified Clostridium]MDV4149805.1 carbohydrate-binding protein [Clostridium sp. AL.422]